MISRNFRSQEIFLFEKMDVIMASRLITKNSAADPEIGFNVLVRTFLEKKGVHDWARAYAARTHFQLGLRT